MTREQAGVIPITTWEHKSISDNDPCWALRRDPSGTGKMVWIYESYAYRADKQKYKLRKMLNGTYIYVRY